MNERRIFLKQLAMLTGGLMIPINTFDSTNRDKWENYYHCILLEILD